MLEPNTLLSQRELAACLPSFFYFIFLKFGFSFTAYLFVILCHMCIHNSVSCKFNYNIISYPASNNYKVQISTESKFLKKKLQCSCNYFHHPAKKSITTFYNNLRESSQLSLIQTNITQLEYLPNITQKFVLKKIRDLLNTCIYLKRKKI